MKTKTQTPGEDVCTTEESQSTKMSTNIILTNGEGENTGDCYPKCYGLHICPYTEVPTCNETKLGDGTLKD